MELYLLRHGTTTANQEGRFQGRLDYPLSPAGRKEALRLASRLKGSGIEVLLASDLIRAWETARVISEAIGVAPVKEPLLRECSWGFLEGLTRAEVNKRFPFFLSSCSSKVNASRCGGESERKLLARSRLMLKRIKGQYYGNNRIALVSHGRFINAFLSAAFKVAARHHWPFAPGPASLTIISVDKNNGNCRLKLFNDCCHLTGLKDT